MKMLTEILSKVRHHAHGNATLAKWLSILSLIVAAVALAVSVAAIMDRAGDAQGSANRALDSVRAQ